MAEILGVDRRRTVAVGDYYNDVSMVASAGVGFAVENAVDELKAVADFVTVSNNSHAIAAIVDGLDKGKYTLNVK
jgi:hydroxymethylpyrimidine pyrophosphatase-like HAD family hydrolase